MRKLKPKRKSRKGEKHKRPLSLYGMSFDEALGRLAQAKAIPVLSGPDADTLGRVVGSSAVQAVGVRDAQLAKGLKAKYEAQRAQEE